MKKQIREHAMRIRPHVKKPAVAAAILLAALCYTIPLEAGQNTAEAVISHRHTGDSDRGSGCYSIPQYHRHEGDRQQGGGCYCQEMYHVHTGNEKEGGGCYGAVRLHAHEGDTAGGGCYTKPVYHTHTGACYQDQTCSVRCVGVGEAYQVSDSWCGCHGHTTLNEANVSWEHSSCGAGRQSRRMQYLSYHGWEDQLNAQSHTYRSLKCSQGGQIDTYEIGCGMEEGSIMGYDTDCGKSGDVIEYYELDCGKTQDTIDCYTAGCDMNEDTRLGILVLRAEPLQEWATGVRLSASYRMEHSFDIKEACYIWNEQEAVADSLYQVTENGTYTVRLNGGEDSDAGQVHASMTIRNIDHTAPSVTAFEGVPDNWINQAVTINVQAADLQPAKHE